MYALNAASGQVVSKFATAGLVESTPVVNGAVYVGSNDGKVYALTTESLAPSG